MTIIRDVVLSVSAEDKAVFTQSGKTVQYSKLCLCHGARPKMVQCQSSSKYVRGIRDTESVRDFQKDLAGAKRVLIVGNGGIGKITYI